MNQNYFWVNPTTFKEKKEKIKKHERIFLKKFGGKNDNPNFFFAVGEVASKICKKRDTNQF